MRDFVASPGSGLSDTGMLSPGSGPAGRARSRDAVVEGFRSRSASSGSAPPPPPRRVTDTAVTQPLVVAAALLAYEELERRGSLPADTIAAGHSVGEPPRPRSRVLSSDDAVTLAAIRGAEMAKACALEPTGMSRSGGRRGRGAVPARGARPHAGQPQRGRSDSRGRAARVSRAARRQSSGEGPRTALPVAGAFHTTRFMAPARTPSSPRPARITPGDPTRTLLSNSAARGHFRRGRPD